MLDDVEPPEAEAQFAGREQSEGPPPLPSWPQGYWVRSVNVRDFPADDATEVPVPPAPLPLMALSPNRAPAVLSEILAAARVVRQAIGVSGIIVIVLMVALCWAGVLQFFWP